MPNTDKNTPDRFHIVMTGQQIHAELARKVETIREEIAKDKMLAAAGQNAYGDITHHNRQIASLESFARFIDPTQTFRLEREDLVALNLFSNRNDGCGRSTNQII